MTLENLQNLSLEHMPRRRTDPLESCRGASLEGDFTLDEQIVIRETYSELQQLLTLSNPDFPDKQAQFAQLKVFMRDNELLSLEDQFLAMLDETDDKDRRRLISQLAHGPLESICAYIIFSRAGSLEPEYILQLYYATRDQLKIMRRLVHDLDPDRRTQDEERKLHSIELLIEKWKSTIYRAHAGEVEVAFEQFYSGDVAERCLEFAELDRIVYHLVNHCARYSANKKMTIAVAEARSGTDLLWAFRKKMTSRRMQIHLKRLEKGESLFGHELPDTDSDRLDLAIVADAVANAYGYEDNLEAEKDGIYGAKIENGHLIIWLHWPQAGC